MLCSFTWGFHVSHLFCLSVTIHSACIIYIYKALKYRKLSLTSDCIHSASGEGGGGWGGVYVWACFRLNRASYHVSLPTAAKETTLTRIGLICRLVYPRAFLRLINGVLSCTTFCGYFISAKEKAGICHSKNVCSHTRECKQPIKIGPTVSTSLLLTNFLAPAFVTVMRLGGCSKRASLKYYATP